jgi:hypothetical protein
MIQEALVDIQSTQDLLEKAMKLSGLVTTVFKKAGWDLVVVGGSAVEFYTEGAYMSKGGIDINWDETERLADLPSFRILEEFRRFKKEVSDEINLTP